MTFSFKYLNFVSEKSCFSRRFGMVKRSVTVALEKKLVRGGNQRSSKCGTLCLCCSWESLPLAVVFPNWVYQPWHMSDGLSYTLQPSTPAMNTCLCTFLAQIGNVKLSVHLFVQRFGTYLQFAEDFHGPHRNLYEFSYLLTFPLLTIRPEFTLAHKKSIKPIVKKCTTHFHGLRMNP